MLQDLHRYWRQAGLRAGVFRGGLRIPPEQVVGTDKAPDNATYETHRSFGARWGNAPPGALKHARSHVDSLLTKHDEETDSRCD
jgi:hypothetical protein